MKKLHLTSIVSLASLPIMAISSCAATSENEVNLFLNSLLDSFAKQTYQNEDEARRIALECSLSIINSKESIPNNIVNASIFSKYPYTQQIRENLIMQIEPLSAKTDGTKIILTIRVAYSYNENLNVKHYSENKNLVIEFFAPILPVK